MTPNQFDSDQIEAVEFESGVNLFISSLKSAIGSLPSDDSPMILPIDFEE